MEENLNLQWGYFHQHVLDSRKEIFNLKHFTDVTLISKDKKHIPAHKSIIGPASALLNKVLLAQNTENPTTKIFLKDIMEEELSALLQFIYLGETVIQETRLNEFRTATQVLQIVGLEESKTGRLVDQPKSITDTVQEAPQMSPLLDQDSKNLMNFLSAEQNDKNNSMILESDPTPQINVQKTESMKSTNTSDKNDSEQPTGYINVGNIKKEESGLVKKRKSSWGGRLKGLESGNEIFDVKMDSNGKVARFYNGVNIDVGLDCPECDKNFVNQHSLRDHIRYKHIGIKFDCHLCDYKATKKFSLKFHIQSMHFGIMFPCNYCSYKNAKKPRLNLHILKKHGNILSSSELEALNCKDLLLKELREKEKQGQKRQRKKIEIRQIRSNMGSICTNSTVTNRELHSLFTPVGN